MKISQEKETCVERSRNIQDVQPELTASVQVQVLPNTQQQRQDQELKSQGQQNIYAVINITGGGEYFAEKENTANWVRECEENIRLGRTLPRLELLKLAELRLEDKTNIYRHSGREMDGKRQATPK